MKRPFTIRVEIEREVLSLVNSHFKFSTLHGLSESAITSWYHDSDTIPEDILNDLLTISSRLKLNVDASKNVFVGNELKLKFSVRTYIQKLQAKLLNED